MTTEEKARAYEAALERAKQLKEHNKDDKALNKWVCKTFPELKESEDEKIRKGLIEYFKHVRYNGLDLKTTNVDEVLVWLEKQKSIKTPQWMIDFLDKNRGEFASLMGGYDEQREAEGKLLAIISWLEKQKELTSDEEKQGKEDVLWCINQAKKHAKDENEMGTCWFAEKWLEKQGDSEIPQVYETKNGEVITYSESEGYKVVKPKFKVGDWCIDNEDNTIFQITKVLTNLYYYRTNEGKEYSCTRDSIEHDAHLWTIQDAKDGDVLAVDPIDTYPSPFVAIYKKQNGEDFDSYCFIGFDGKFYKGENEHSTEEIYPATKEQRELLFKKMKEAGYEWSNKDRKLIKTEEQSEQGAINDTNEEVSEELKAASILHSELVRNQSCIDEDFIAGAQWLKRQNCAWSEEDEEMFNNIIEDDLMPYGEQDKIDWLNLLKERIN